MIIGYSCIVEPDAMSRDWIVYIYTYITVPSSLFEWSSGAMKYILCIFHEMKINILLIFFISLKYLPENLGNVWKFFSFL